MDVCCHGFLHSFLNCHFVSKYKCTVDVTTNLNLTDVPSTYTVDDWFSFRLLQCKIFSIVLLSFPSCAVETIYQKYSAWEWLFTEYVTFPVRCLNNEFVV